MKIAFMCAMPEEYRAVASHLDAPVTLSLGRYKACGGSTSCHDVVLLETGMGFDNAARAAETVISNLRPDILISAGFCGGITPGLNVGAVVVATRIIIVSGDTVDEVPVEFAAAGLNFVVRQSQSAQPAFGGLFVSTPVISAKAAIAERLPSGSKNPVLEMESAAIAMIAAENGIPFVGIRSVSDPSSEELGFTLDEFCDNNKRIRIPRVLLTIVKKPHIIPQLFRLARNSKIAEASLTRAVKDFLASA